MTATPEQGASYPEFAVRAAWPVYQERPTPKMSPARANELTAATTVAALVVIRAEVGRCHALIAAHGQGPLAYLAAAELRGRRDGLAEVLVGLSGRRPDPVSVADVIASCAQDAAAARRL